MPPRSVVAAVAAAVTLVPAVPSALTTTPTAASAPEPAATDDLRPGQAAVIAGTGVDGPSAPDGTPAAEADLNSDLALAVGDDGTIYLADPTDEQVRTVDADGILGSVPELAGDGVRSVAVADDGTVYAGGDGTVKAWHPDGATRTIPTPGMVVTDLDSAPDGGLVLVDEVQTRVVAVTVDGEMTTLADADDGLVMPQGVAVDSDGAVYVTRPMPTAVHRIGSDGSVEVVTEPSDFHGGGGPALGTRTGEGLAGLDIGPDDTLYVADAHSDVIRSISSGAVATVSTLFEAARGLRAGGSTFASLNDVAMGPTGDLYVTLGGQVARVRPSALVTGLFEAPIDSSDYPDPWADREPGAVVTVTGGDPLDEPFGVSVGPDGTLFVASGADWRLWEVTTDGSATPVTDQTGRPQIGVIDVAVSPAGELAMARGNDGLMLERPDGVMVRLATPYESSAWGDQRAAIGVPAETVAMQVLAVGWARDGLYVVDTAHRSYTDGAVIRRIGPDGTLVEEVDAGSRAIGGIDVTDDGTVVVADSSDGRVVSLPPDDFPEVIADVHDQPAEGPRMRSASDVAVDSDGTIYVAGTHGIIGLPPDDSAIAVLSPAEAELDQGAGTSSIALDGHGNLYFADPVAGVVGVVVRPGEMSAPIDIDPATVAWSCAALVGVAGLWVHRRARRSSLPMKVTT